MPTYKLIANIVLFQAGWFACILLPVEVSLFIVAVILMCHFLWVVSSCDRKTEAALLIIVFVCGAVIEWAYLYAGVLVKHQGSLFPPVWLLCLWVLFATTLRYSLAWLRQRWLLAACFAALAAPMSYYAGANLRVDMSLGNVVLSLVVIALSWALVFPLLMNYVVQDKQGN